MALEWDELLIGAPGRRWRTASTTRRVLVVVHNVTAATRLLDVVPLWAGDLRVQTVFSCIGSSAFTTGTTDFLGERGITPVDWEQAVRGDFDLAVTASYGGPLHEISAPLVVLPHGMGYNKFLKSREIQGNPGKSREIQGNPGKSREIQGNPVFGLSDAWLLHEGEVVPSVAVLSHHEQRDRLARYCPEAVPVALVAGDPCFDRMLASRPLRDSYRHRLGIDPDQRCVAISSTWGGDSLFGQHPSLVLRLAQQLPLDEYRVVVALHPNIWHGHSPWQVRMWLAECARAGVVVLPPEEGWRAGLVAADLTIGDHGSVTFYSAALGTPVLLATWPEETVDPASPIAALLRTAPRLDPHAPLAGQVDAAITAHRAADFADITDLATSEPGRSAPLLRAEIYTRLELEEPPAPADSAAVPLPTAPPSGVGSQLVQVRLADHAASVTRFPAAALDEPTTSGGVLVACADEPDRRWLELAEVLVHDDRYADPLRWVRSSLSRLPGSMLAATRDGAGHWVIGGADLPGTRVTGPADLGPVCAAVLHAWLCSGRSPREIPDQLRITLGQREELVRLSTQD